MTLAGASCSWLGFRACLYTQLHSVRATVLPDIACIHMLHAWYSIACTLHATALQCRYVHADVQHSLHCDRHKHIACAQAAVLPLQGYSDCSTYARQYKLPLTSAVSHHCKPTCCGQLHPCGVCVQRRLQGRCRKGTSLQEPIQQRANL